MIVIFSHNILSITCVHFLHCVRWKSIIVLFGWLWQPDLHTLSRFINSIFCWCIACLTILQLTVLKNTYFLHSDKQLVTSATAVLRYQIIPGTNLIYYINTAVNVIFFFFWFKSVKILLLYQKKIYSHSSWAMIAQQDWWLKPQLQIPVGQEHRPGCLDFLHILTHWHGNCNDQLLGWHDSRSEGFNMVWVPSYEGFAGAASIKCCPVCQFMLLFASSASFMTLAFSDGNTAVCLWKLITFITFDIAEVCCYRSSAQTACCSTFTEIYSCKLTLMTFVTLKQDLKGLYEKLKGCPKAEIALYFYFFQIAPP